MSTPGPDAVLLDWPLVGRAAELDRVAAALARPECAGVVLVGAGGVGKTRLAAECLSLAERSGFSTARAVATRSTSGITLGALAPLLPDLGERTVNLLGAAREALAERAGDRPLLLFVDDAHLLDEVSAALLLQIASGSRLFVLMTVRSDEAVSDAVTALWKDGIAERIDVEPLDQLDVDELILAALGGAVDPVARVELLRVSAGNPLALRELLLGALAAGSLVEEGDVWRLAGPLAVSSRLADLVEVRLGRLDDAAYGALELVTLGEPLGVGLLEPLVGAEAVETLEQRGLVRVRADARRLEVWLAHPLYGEVVRSRMGVLRARNVLRRLADAVEARGGRRRGDLLRIATWRLESGSPADAAVLAAAARQAYVVLDLELARRLSATAWESEHRFDAGLLLGHVLCELGRFAEAEEVLARVAGLAGTDEERVLVTMARSENLFRLERCEEAVAVTLAAEAEIDDPDWRAELVGHRATFEMLLGRVREALALVEPHLAGNAVRPMIQGAISGANILAWDGRVDDALAVAERAYGAHLDIWEHELFQSDPGIHAVGIVMALLQAGRLEEAGGLLDLAWQAANEQQAIHAMAWFAFQAGLLHELRGRPAISLEWHRRANGYFSASSLHGRRRWPLGGALLDAAMLGRVDDAAALAAELDGITSCVRINHAGLADARAWWLAARGELERARDLLDATADEATAEGARALAARALHSLARLGAPERARDRLDVLGAQAQGRLVPARAAHVQALAGGDAAGLLAAGAAFEAMGADLYAAEAFADAARALRAANRARDAGAAARESRRLVAQCQGAATPALVLVEAASPLTRREREVALLAAQGLSSKVIAEQLFLSVRTVENHLQRAYDKLGVSGREELASAVARLGGAG